MRVTSLRFRDNLAAATDDSERVQIAQRIKRKAGGQPEVLGTTVQGHFVYGKIASVYVSNLDTWNNIANAYAEAKAAAESSAEYKTQQLCKERRSLTSNLKCAQDELYEAQQRRVEAMGNGEHYRYDAGRMESEIESAKASLQAFDEMYPKIIALLKQEQDESVERNRWN